MDTPRVSVIIPTYNHACFLHKAINSLVAQTMGQWEAIVVNNYSDDNTIEIVKFFSDERIKLVNFANNGIIAASRNRGLELARAPIIAFLDSDDFWYPEKLARCLVKLENGFDLVCHNEVWAGPAGRRRVVEYGPDARATYDSLLLEGNCLSTSAIIVRKELLNRLGGFSENFEFITAEDYELWLRIAKDGAKIGFVRTVLGEYLIHESNQSRAALRNMDAVNAVFNRHKSALNGRVSAWRLRRREATILYSGARGLQDSGEHQEAWPLFFQAILRFPLLPKFYIAAILNALGRQP